jgi:4-aminobutyrate aminotransferase/(S)-3-amino-2-methylpropionate transaminase
LLIRAGLFSNCIRFLPPLNMPEDMLREALEAVEHAIEETAGAREVPISAAAR